MANEFLPIVKQCQGCENIVTDVPLIDGVPPVNTCRRYLEPAAHWHPGRSCQMATHLKKEEKTEAFLDPIKASKRMKGKK